ncbi:MAG: hypothetical protein IT305_28670 [Chloroflexi bacterium]|nr:hypothetical protein [Chloroflexota bacterium]
MKTQQIGRYLSSFALAAALTALAPSAIASTAFAATPGVSDMTVYDDEGEYTAEGLEYGGAALGIASGVVDAVAGTDEAGQYTSGGLQIGAAAVGGLAPAIVREATR